MEARIILKGSVTKDGIGTQEARIENEDTRKEEANSSYALCPTAKEPSMQLHELLQEDKKSL